jgi:hypothetical protein
MGSTQSRRAAEGSPRDVSDVYKELHRDQLAIDTLVAIECIILALWMAMVYVTGFALYTVAPSVVVSSGWGHTVSHLGWWNIIEFVVIIFGLRSTKFVLAPSTAAGGTEGTRLKFALGRAKTWLVAHAVVLVLGAIADIVDIVLTGLEFGDAESTCFFSSWGFLLAFLIILCLQLLFVKLPLLWCVLEYRRHLNAASNNNSTIKSQLFDPVSTRYGSQLKTPLLQQQQQQQQQQQTVDFKRQ